MSKQTKAQKRTQSLIDYYAVPERAPMEYSALYGLLTLGLALDVDSVHDQEWRARRAMLDTAMLAQRLDAIRASWGTS